MLHPRGVFLFMEQAEAIYTNLIDRIDQLAKRVGNTPMHDFSWLIRNKGVKLFAKKEWKQIGGSIKARAAFNIFREAVRNNKLHEGKILLDATSGNTGIAYASIGKELGIRVALCIPENASAERKSILNALGAEIIFTSKFEGTDGAQELAREMVSKDPGLYYYADQYKNDNNWKAHYEHTAIEIIDQVPSITHFVAGLGTTGTFVGTGRRMRELNENIRLISLQPDSALHGLEGWKHLETAMVPPIYDASVADESHEVSTEDAYAMMNIVHKKSGLVLSPSSAANLAGAVQLAERMPQGIIVTVLPDNGDKYSEVVKKIIG